MVGVLLFRSLRRDVSACEGKISGAEMLVMGYDRGEPGCDRSPTIGMISEKRRRTMRSKKRR